MLSVEKRSLIPENNLHELIIQSLLEKQGIDVVLINLKKVKHVLFDYFIICTGNSKPHIDTLVEHIRKTVQQQLNIKPSFIEGIDNAEWVLLDYFNIIVHIFQPEARDYYSLEKLWSDAEIINY